MKKVRKLWDPSVWASWKPFGIGEQRPNNFFEVFRAIWENRDRLGYTWRILNEGVCDGCSLGTKGMRDWTMDGIHLCNVRLRLLRLNTMGSIDNSVLSNISELRAVGGRRLRKMGRLSHPMLRRRGEPGFEPVSWDSALDMVADRIRGSSPERLAFYLTSRGIPNETYYAAQKAVRAMGTNSIDNAARVCHSPSTGTLKKALGVGATTCSYSDWIGTDLIVFVGCNVANNQPVTMKYLHYARKAGTKVAVVNPYREPGMDRYWVPSTPESALFGTQVTDRFFLINVGGDIAFLNGAIKHMITNDWLDREFVDGHTSGFDELKSSLDRQSWDELESLSGVSRQEMLEFARMIARADRAVFVWAMGITQHAFGEDNVTSIINLALTKGFVGHEGSGLMPIRGHSGVQGGAEMGAYATVFPGGLPINAENARWLQEKYGFDIGDQPGKTATEMIDAASEGGLDLLFAAGGNFVDVLPDPDYVEDALRRVPLRVHMDIVLNPQMFIEPGEEVLLLPAATRYEIPGGVTQTSTERRVIFSPEVEGPRPAEARPEWEVFLELARRARPDRVHHLDFASTDDIRREIADVIPRYDGIQNLRKAGDQFQYGGPHLCADWEFPTPNGKAHFQPTDPPRFDVPEGSFVMTTRRGKQFNSMVQESVDALTGAAREAVLISEEDADRLGVRAGDPVLLKNDVGEFKGRAAPAPLKPGSLQVHWPEGNVLIDRERRSPVAQIPDYNAVVSLERLPADGEETLI